MSSMRPRFLLALCSLAAASLLGPRPDPWGAGPLVAVARADDAPALSSCTLKGSPSLTKGLQVFDAPAGGKVVAEFIGGAAPLALTLAADPVNQRSRASTSNGRPTVRIDGWLSASSVPVYAVKDVPVVGDHVKIAGAHQVKLVKGAGANLTAELTIAGSQNQVLKGTAGCDSFSLAWGKPAVTDPPETARNYLMKGTSLDLFDRANGESIYTLSMSDGASPLFWGIESRGMFLHVVSRSDVAVDAWVKLGTLTPLKKGDRIDPPLTPPSAGAGSRMVLENPPPPKTAVKDIPIRASRDEKEKTIGVVESGAEFFVTQVVSGWASVLPKSLDLSPPEGGGFWVQAADLPKLARPRLDPRGRPPGSSSGLGSGVIRCTLAPP